MLRDEQDVSLEVNIPSYLVCPVTQLIYLEPVTVFPSGHVYEEEVIEYALQKAAKKNIKASCPLTRKPIDGYVTAWNIKSAVDDYIKKNENAVNQRYVREKPNQKQEPENINDKSVSHQIEKDAEFAKKLQEQEIQELQPQLSAEREGNANAYPRHRRQYNQPEFAIQEQQPQPFLSAERERNANAAYRQQVKRQYEQQISEVRSQTQTKINLSDAETKECERLIDDVQNLIYALHFEQGPRPKGRIDNFSLLFLAVIEQACLPPLPWQKIKVNEGPKPPAMYEILKAAKLSLKETNPIILENAKAKYEGQYDVVKTVFAGEKSLGNKGYGAFAQAMGTITNQPGDLVNIAIKKVDLFFQKFVNKTTLTYR